MSNFKLIVLVAYLSYSYMSRHAFNGPQILGYHITTSWNLFHELVPVMSYNQRKAETYLESLITNRKWQDYVYIQCEYKSTKQKIKHLLREENKVKENKIS